MITKSAVAIAESRIGKPLEKYFAGRVNSPLERSWLAFKSSTWIIVLSGFLEPVLFLFSFGFGVGSLIGDISNNGQTISYAAYIAPGLLATSAMNGAVYDSTWNVFWKINESKLYQSMLSTSLGALDVALGEIAWALFRGLIYALGFMVVVTPLGLVTSWWGLLAIPAAVLIAFGFASFGMALTSYMKSYQQMNMINIFMLPMFLFSGSFFPITVYPQYIQWLIQALPLWHAISLVRGIMLGHIGIATLLHILYFFAMIALGLLFTTKRLTALFLR